MWVRLPRGAPMHREFIHDRIYMVLRGERLELIRYRVGFNQPVEHRRDVRPLTWITTFPYVEIKPG